MWFWNSNIRSTAITLGALIRNAPDDLSAIRPLVRWLVESRQKGRWGNTQENAWALEALVDYYRKFESVSPQLCRHGDAWHDVSCSTGIRRPLHGGVSP